MSAAKNGGPAFPTLHIPDCSPPAWSGMALRDYFLAHAPAEPQSWFIPTMDTERPAVPMVPETLTEADKNDLSGWNDFYGTDDLTEPGAKAFALAYDEAVKAGKEWDRAFERARCIQWPFAWADAILAERAKGGDA